HVEGAEHLVVGDAATLAQQLEDRRLDPGPPPEAGAQAFRQAARQVAVDAAAGDVGGPLPCDRPQLLEVRPVRLEQLLAQRAAHGRAPAVAMAVTQVVAMSTPMP